MQPHPDLLIPEETVRVAEAMFREGIWCSRLRKDLEALSEDESLADLFSSSERPAGGPWRLALIAFLQYRDELSDLQAAEAVQVRIDWKYLLGLELTDPGFDVSVLSAFWHGLITKPEDQRIFQLLVTRLSERGWLNKRRDQHFPSMRAHLFSVPESHAVLATWEIRFHNQNVSPKEWESKSSEVACSRTDLPRRQHIGP